MSLEWVIIQNSNTRDNSLKAISILKGIKYADYGKQEQIIILLKVILLGKVDSSHR